MLKKIDILGIQIDNYTVREAMTKVDGYLESTGMNTIETIDMEMLDVAGTNECVRECIAQLDQAVVGEKEILVAAGVRSNQRMSETINHDFFREFMKRVARHKKKVFLLGETEEQIENLRKFMESKYERIPIAGTCTLEDKSGDLLSVVNEINSATAEVLLSVLSTPQQEEFLMENKNKLDVQVWYGVGNHYVSMSYVRKISSLAGKLIHKRKLKSRLHKYNKN